jgi:hypothetical protein
MTECDHPAPDRERLLRGGGRGGEYVVQIGSDLAQGPIPTDKLEEAIRLIQEETGATSRTYRSGNKRCPACGGWWSETRIRAGRPDDYVAEALLSS